MHDKNYYLLRNDFITVIVINNARHNHFPDSSAGLCLWYV